MAQEELAEGVRITFNVPSEQLRIGWLRVRSDALAGPGVPRLGAARLVRFRRRPPLGPGPPAARRLLPGSSWLACSGRRSVSPSPA